MISLGVTPFRLFDFKYYELLAPIPKLDIFILLDVGECSILHPQHLSLHKSKKSSDTLGSGCSSISVFLHLPVTSIKGVMDTVSHEAMHARQWRCQHSIHTKQIQQSNMPTRHRQSCLLGSE